VQWFFGIENRRNTERITAENKFICFFFFK